MATSLKSSVILTMVLGIGVTTAVLSVVNSVLLKPLPFAGAARTVQFSFLFRDGRDMPIMSYQVLQDYRKDALAFSNFAAATSDGTTLTQGDNPVQLSITHVDEGYRDVFGDTCKSSGPCYRP